MVAMRDAGGARDAVLVADTVMQRAVAEMISELRVEAKAHAKAAVATARPPS